METSLPDHRWAIVPLLLFALALALVAFDCGNVAEASPMSQRDALARVCAVEEGLGDYFEAPYRSNGCAAIAGALARRSRTGEFSASIACAYSAHFHDDCSPRGLGRAWTHELDGDCARPPSFPARLRWRPEVCRRLYVDVDAILAGERRADCTGEPNHFGSARDAARLLSRPGYTSVWCPGARSIFAVGP